MAYPRLRGEHHLFAFEQQLLEGLPPLARGTLAHINRAFVPRWPTPACAGNTSGIGASDGDQEAYPRLRGEHASSACMSASRDGLPPLARGTLSMTCRFRRAGWPLAGL